jgi:hypothetical protein
MMCWGRRGLTIVIIIIVDVVVDIPRIGRRNAGSAEWNDLVGIGGLTDATALIAVIVESSVAVTGDRGEVTANDSALTGDVAVVNILSGNWRDRH